MVIRLSKVEVQNIGLPSTCFPSVLYEP